YTGFLRAFSEPVARAALVGMDGDATLLDELFGRAHARLRTEPERYRFRYFVTATLFTRH
ncbi:MAG: cyclopropane-fatty-acyl-phospholipid synthase, partial [Gemmataceae bacterium]